MLVSKALLNMIIFILLTSNRSLSLSIVSYIQDVKLDPHTSSIVVDSHIDTLTKIIDEKTWLPTTDIGDETSFESDIPKLRSGGINVPFLAAYTAGYYNHTPRSLSHT